MHDFQARVTQGMTNDLVLVAGTEPEVGPNLLDNGGFESGLLDPWVVSSNHTDRWDIRA